MQTSVCDCVVSRQGSLASTASGVDFGNQPMPEEEGDLLDSPEQQRVGLRADASTSRQPYRMLSSPQGTSPTGHKLKQRAVSWGPRDATLNSEVSMLPRVVSAASCIHRGSAMFLCPYQNLHQQVPQTVALVWFDAVCLPNGIGK